MSNTCTVFLSSAEGARALSIYETDDFMTIEKFLHHYSPELNFKVYPIVETTEIIKIRSK